MSQRRIPTPGEVPHLLRDQLGELQEASKNLASEVKNDPQSFLENPVTRITGLVIAGVVGVVLLIIGVQSIIPPSQIGPDEAPTALVHVACTAPDCRNHSLTKLPVDFDDWPHVCAKCSAESVYRAKRCRETRRWYAVAPGAPDISPFKKPEQPQVVAEDAPKRKKGDDAEDGW